MESLVVWRRNKPKTKGREGIGREGTGREGTGRTSDVVKVKGEEPATPGYHLRSDESVDNPGTGTIPPYRVNKTKQNVTKLPPIALPAFLLSLILSTPSFSAYVLLARVRSSWTWTSNVCLLCMFLFSLPRPPES